MTEGQYIPIADRPAFVRKVVAVWRLHHLARGEELAVFVPAGEWPADGPAEVGGAVVDHPDWYTYANGVMVLGLARGEIRFAISIAHRMLAAWSTEDLTRCTLFGDLPLDAVAADGRVWFPPDPVTGETPMFRLPRRPRS